MPGFYSDDTQAELARRNHRVAGTLPVVHRDVAHLALGVAGSPGHIRSVVKCGVLGGGQLDRRDDAVPDLRTGGLDIVSSVNVFGLFGQIRSPNYWLSS